MSRLENRVLMGYFPLEERHYPALFSLIQPATPATRYLDPFAGEGAFLAASVKVWNVTPYANELDENRARQCSVFFALKDLGKWLPQYEEIALPVEMDADTFDEYDRTRALLKDYLIQPPRIIPRAAPRSTPVRVHNPALNPDLIRAVQDELEARFAGFGKRNGFVASLCPLGLHTLDRPGKHFTFDPIRGYGHCFGRHGTANLHELCDALGLDAEDYGGIYARKLADERHPCHADNKT